ncbi:MAG: hypothetical protein WBE76_24415 [Terracidiphilus sp.]
MRAIRPAMPAIAVILAALCLPSLFAQDDRMPPESVAPPAASAAAPHRQARPGAAHPAVAATSAAQAAAGTADPATPAPAPMPQWPINEQPAQPVVTWDSHGLSIDAANSSLQQILKAISVATGAKVDGMTGDQRVFGEYGPGQARDVLSQLLLGAGYNVIMVGDLGEGTPRQILLSVRRAGKDANDANGNQANNNDDDSADNDADDQQPVQPVMRPGFPGGFPRSPQQMLEERQRMMQERQQQIQQQLQNNQQSNPQN